MLMKDANILRKRFERRLKQISPDSVAAYCIRMFLGVIDELPDVEVESADDYESLLRRFRHLIQSDYIRSFDELGSDGKYKRDIAEAGLFRPQIFSVGLVCSDDPNCSPFDGNAMTQAEYFGLNGGGGEMAKECPFCRKMRVEKKRLKVSGTQARYKYAAALVTRIFLKGIRGQKAMHTDYSETDYGYKLNFCPVCGKKMDGGASDE